MHIMTLGIIVQSNKLLQIRQSATVYKYCILYLIFIFIKKYNCVCIINLHFKFKLFLIITCILNFWRSGLCMVPYGAHVQILETHVSTAGKIENQGMI